jgi:hypothetical protein
MKSLPAPRMESIDATDHSGTDFQYSALSILKAPDHQWQVEPMLFCGAKRNDNRVDAGGNRPLDLGSGHLE